MLFECFNLDSVCEYSGLIQQSVSSLHYITLKTPSVAMRPFFFFIYIFSCNELKRKTQTFFVVNSMLKCLR